MEIIKQSFLIYSGRKVFVKFILTNDESAAYIEIYAKKIHASSHPAQLVLDLRKTKYIGLQIPHHIPLNSETLFNFVIAFENEVVSFGCKRWELMNEWVNCLNNKLRELKVLNPKENIYTKPPSMKPPILQMTRNPRDPLPLAPSSITEVPGLEVLQTRTQIESQSRSSSTSSATTTMISDSLHSYNEESSQSTLESLIESFTVSNNNISEDDDDDDDDEAEQNNPISIPIFNFATSNTSSQNLINLLSNPLCRYASNNADLHFANNFSDEQGQEENDDDLNDLNENNEDNANEFMTNVLTTSLNIEYIPEINENDDNVKVSRDNITIIPVVAESCNEANGIHSSNKTNTSDATKIKIEVAYDHLCKAISSPVNHRSSNQAPSTSTLAIKNIVEKTEISTKSAPCTPSKRNPSLMATVNNQKSATPLHEKRKLSIREQQVLQLRQEINTEIRFKLRKKDCVDAIAFASYNDTLYIAGFKANPQLYVLHVGDQLLAINNIANIKSAADAQKFIKMCAGLFVEVTIKRLPFAFIGVIKRDFENQCLGLIRDGASLLDIIPNSTASRSGIPSRPFSSQNDDDSIFWIITEINFRPLSMVSHKKYDETELLLNNAIGLETSLLLQPSDFIAKLRKDLKAIKNYRDYTLQ